MDSISVFFVSVIIFLGGLTAYIADLLGRYMGKKKLTFLGIRPKYTAISFTVFAGIFIPFVTIIFLYYFSSDVHVWLKEGQNAVIQRDRKVKELEHMITKIIERTAEVKDLEIKQSEAKLKLNQAQQNIEKAKLQTIKMRKDLQRITIQFNNIKLNYKNLRKNFEIIQINSIDLKFKNNELLKVQTKFINDLDNKTKQIQEISVHLLALQKHVDDLNQQKKVIYQQFNETSTQLRKDIEYTQNQLILARNERDNLVRETEDFKKKGLDLNIYNTRFTSIVFNQGEELASIVFPAQASLLKVNELIEELKMKASLKAKEKKTDLEHALSDDQVQHLYKQLTSRPESVKTMLSVAWNTFENETVPYNILIVEQNQVHER